MADVQVKRKIGVSPHARITPYSSTPNSPTRPTRPTSPSKRSQFQSASTISEQLRPRAKISSAATVVTSKKPPSSLGAGYASGSTTPRAPSPIRRQSSQQESGRSSPKLAIRTLSRVRSKAALSAISVPSSPRVGSVKAQYASLSAATSDSALSRTSPPRARKPSLSSVSQLSIATNGVCSPPLSAVSYSRDSDTQSTVSTARIKAKVTNLAKGKPPPHVQPIPSPLLMPSPMLDRTMSQAQASSPSVGSHVRQRLARTASIGSFSAPPTPQVYPITTASPAANVHRYATLRSPSYTHRPTPSFTSPLQADHKPPAQSDSASLAPPPPLSPPVSNVSFSSQSSVSRPSLTPVNHVSLAGIHANGDERRRNSSTSFIVNGINERVKSRSNSFVIHDIVPHQLHRADSSEPDDYQNSEERTIMAEAKSHRKIADLEITNKSLLTINSQLEANKHKQAKEIRDLRRKLRESQLALPPRTYSKLKASGDAIENDRDEEEFLEEQEVDRAGDEEAMWNAEAVRLGKDDVIFNRVRLILESLLTTGKQALALKVEDLAPPKGTAKVLHEVEARTWREGTSRGASGVATPAGGDPTDDATLDDSGSESDYGIAISQRIGDQSLQSNDSRRSEREVEELIGNLKSSLSTSLRA